MRPGGLRHRAFFVEASACELLFAVDQFGVFAFTSLRTAQEVDLFCDDLTALAVDPGGIGPLGVVDATVNLHLHALFAVVGDRLAETVEAGNAVPFGVHEPGSQEAAGQNRSNEQTGVSGPGRKNPERRKGHVNNCVPGCSVRSVVVGQGLRE